MENTNHANGNIEVSSEASPSTLVRLLREAARPLRLCQDVCDLLDAGTALNYVDDSGCTPLGVLVLHINRGLRYHNHRIPELAILEDSNALSRAITEKCIEIDSVYQDQVREALKLLLEKGAECNVIPGSCPGIPYDITWSENYEHKIIQTEQRWNLFTFGISMEFSTYSIFNPLSTYRPTNAKGVTVLHLAAWRGDADCLELLLKHNANVHTCTTDGRNALHFLYQYCNKPVNLALCTSLLIQHGIDTSAVDSNGHTPAFVLLHHIHVKHSHIQYLANAYTEDSTKSLASGDDNFCDMIQQCLELLLEAGASITQTNGEGETLLHFIYSRFEHALRDCEEGFQQQGFYLVPYQFKVMPLIKSSTLLLQLGCPVSTML